MAASTENHIETSSTEDQTQSMNPEISSTFHFSPLDLPIGYRFTPRDEQLIRILHQRQQNVFSNHPIHHVNVYDSNPQHLSERFEKGNDNDEWFFMTERIKVCKGGKNRKRGNNEGYWNARTPSQKIDAGNGLIGYMRQLTYMAGKKPNCIKTDWRMNEYWFMSFHDNNDKVDYALCKIFVTPMATKKKKKKSKEDDNEAVENEENVTILNHDGEYQAHDQIMPQCDHMMMMMPEGEQQQQQVTWSPPLFAQDPQGQDSGLEIGKVVSQIVVHPNPPDMFVEDVEYHEPQIVPHSLMMVQEGEQQQEQQQVTQSPLLPFQDLHGQDPELCVDNLIGPEDEDFWRWWNNYADQLNI